MEWAGGGSGLFEETSGGGICLNYLAHGFFLPNYSNEITDSRKQTKKNTYNERKKFIWRKKKPQLNSS